MTNVFQNDFLNIAFTGVGIEGGCPAANDNDGCFCRADGETRFVPTEIISAHKEYCDCSLTWTKQQSAAMAIPLDEILGAYMVSFERCI